MLKDYRNPSPDEISEKAVSDNRPRDTCNVVFKGLDSNNNIVDGQNTLGCENIDQSEEVSYIEDPEYFCQSENSNFVDETMSKQQILGGDGKKEVDLDYNEELLMKNEIDENCEFAFNKNLQMINDDNDNDNNKNKNNNNNNNNNNESNNNDWGVNVNIDFDDNDNDNNESNNNESKNNDWDVNANINFNDNDFNLIGGNSLQVNLRQSPPQSNNNNKTQD